MKKKYRVDWKSGMKLTDAVFTAADDFHEGQLEPLFALMLRDGYGHFCEPLFRYETDNEVMSVIQMSCKALTASGKFVNINFDHNERNLFQKVPMPGVYDPFIVYVDASSSRHVSFDSGGIPYRDVDYRLLLKPENLSYNNPDAVAIARFKYVQGWNLDLSFIPPSIYLKANVDLLNLSVEYIRKLDQLLTVIKEKSASAMEMMARLLIVPLSMARTEVARNVDNMTPKRLVTIMQQTVGAVWELSEVEKECDVPEPLAVNTFVNSNFDPCKISWFVHEGIRLTEMLTKMASKFPAKPVVEIEMHKPVEPLPVDLGFPKKSDSKRKSWEDNK